MNRSTFLILLLSFTLPAGALAAASSDESSRGCPKSKTAAASVQETGVPVAVTQGSAAAKPASTRAASTPAVRTQPQRWHSLLPGMIR